MSRPLRLDFPGAYHHVMNRGAAHQVIFTTDEDRQRFLMGIQEVSSRWGLRVFSYCLMPNHYHLCVQTGETPLSRVMRHLDGVYTQRFNRIHRRDGPLFRGRYQAKLIEEDAYLLAVVRYIHRNPYSLGIPPATFSWSSWRAYGNRGGPAWLNTDFLLSYFGGDRKAFAQDMRRPPRAGEIAYDPTTCRTPYFGSEDFQGWLATQHTTTSSEREIPERRAVAPSLERCVQVVANVYQTTAAALTRGGRGQVNLARQVAMFTCREIQGASHPVIAASFGTQASTVSAVCARLRPALQRDHRLRRQWRRIHQTLRPQNQQPAT